MNGDLLWNFSWRSVNEEEGNVFEEEVVKRENRDIVGRLNRKIQLPFSAQRFYWSSLAGNMVRKEVDRATGLPGNLTSAV